MTIVKLLIPIIAALLYRLGGQEQISWIPINQKLFRWLGIGLFIGIIYTIIQHKWTPLLSIASYAAAIQIFSYGDNSWLNFLPQNWKHFVSGAAYGLASYPIIGVACILQGTISGLVFYYIEKKQITNPTAELSRGGGGTIMYLLCLLR